MLEIQHLSKTYDDGTQALKDVSFHLEQGEFLVIIGLSGSGKSTLLRCINRLVDPTEGAILLDGEDVAAAEGNSLRNFRRRMGMIFQHFNLVKRSSVLTNVLSGRLGYVNPWKSLLHRFPKSDRDKAKSALERVGLEAQTHKRADELSGGQQQRVGIARALMQEPDLILADEPVASLDPVLAHSIMGYLEKLNKEENMTVLCSLHYLDLVQRYATRVIGLKDGKVVYNGTGEDIRKITDEEFKEIYGEEAVRVGAAGLSAEGGEA
ncbi:phosphonate ABC transporter ATP-binding protein [Salinispira pacifica]|uniref:Phosphonate ABC transporter ATP-binding protein n=1 Tax=Salinispira pacifica TaxID=1307761 RepID=V5WGX1_9SPIO|nr:phosphonate ABC transporter ATP-binding protein [Salinispira pacifica]AHC14880.1 Phosphonate ABC transporter ATP-binding protein [Salinispira pacifica]